MEVLFGGLVDPVTAVNFDGNPTVCPHTTFAAGQKSRIGEELSVDTTVVLDGT